MTTCHKNMYPAFTPQNVTHNALKWCNNSAKAKPTSTCNST